MQATQDTAQLGEEPRQKKIINNIIVVFEKFLYYPGDKVQGKIIVTIDDPNFVSEEMTIIYKAMEFVQYRVFSGSYSVSNPPPHLRFGVGGFGGIRISPFGLGGFGRRGILTNYFYRNQFKRVANFRGVRIHRNKEEVVKKNVYCKHVFKVSLEKDDTGQYIYPFSFDLPKNIPGSFESYSDSSNACVQHYIKVKIDNTNEDCDIGQYRGYGFLLVRNLVDNFKYPGAVQSETNLSTCVRSDDNVKLIVELINYNENSINDKIEGSVIIDNKNSEKICSGITLYLNQTLTLAVDQDTVMSDTRNVLTKEMKEFYVDAGKKKTMNFSIDLKPISDNTNLEHKDYWRFFDVFDNDKGLLNYFVATCSTNMIYNMYTLNFKALYEGCCDCKAYISLPILIQIPYKNDGDNTNENFTKYDQQGFYVAARKDFNQEIQSNFKPLPLFAKLNPEQNTLDEVDELEKYQ